MTPIAMRSDRLAEAIRLPSNAQRHEAWAASAPAGQLARLLRNAALAGKSPAGGMPALH
jgi:hypothetical protein